MKNTGRTRHVTLSEIFGQPELWPKVLSRVEERRGEIVAFLSAARAPGLDVVFTGAGSSSFIGEAVAAAFRRNTGLFARAAATTDIVTHPGWALDPTRPLLLVSLARSGDSPESRAAIEFANCVRGDARHLIITCNDRGALAKLRGKPRTKVLLLPNETNDRGLAMTGSVTSMMLAVLALGETTGDAARAVAAAANCGRDVLDRYDDALRRLAALKFDRAVCLGSGPLLAVAREAHLKIQELSAGRVAATFDSFLGLRHGPRAVVDERTLMLYFANPDPYVARYERDLVAAVGRGPGPMATLTITAPSPHPSPACAGEVRAAAVRTKQPLPRKRERRKVGAGDVAVSLPADASTLAQEWLALPYLIPAQLLAAYKSLALGFDCDAPSPSGAIHRVVRGVTIYPYRKPR